MSSSTTYHVDAGATARVRASVDAFLESELAPGDRIVVMKPLDSIVAIRFADDRTAASAAAASFEGVRGDFRARTAFEQNFLARSPGVVERTRAQVSWTALAALTDALGQAEEGRKTLVVISEGIGPGTGVRGPRAAGVETVARLANSGRVAVYALDPSTAGDRGPLDQLADETNGRAVRGDLEAGLREAAADASGYYWLSYEPSHENDGRFHQLSISVSRPLAVVRSRPGTGRGPRPPIACSRRPPRRPRRPRSTRRTTPARSSRRGSGSRAARTARRA